MLDFLIVVTVFVMVASYFIGPEKAIPLGPKILEYWILAGFAIMIISPFIRIFRFLASVVIKIINICRKLTRKKIPERKTI